MSNRYGTLYVVATPIGNLEDLSPRAERILRDVDLIAAEDTRHSRKLLAAKNISTPIQAYHNFNERHTAAGLIGQIVSGRDVALICDAGTPLISDPGYQLVSMAHAHAVPVVPVPGPSALTAILSVCGLPADKFVFEGFLPAKTVARRHRLQQLAAETRALVLFEAPHRIQASLTDMRDVLGAERPATIARELTKVYETLRQNTLSELLDWSRTNPDQGRGEFVLVISGALETGSAYELERVLRVLLPHLSVREASQVAAEITGQSKNRAYKIALDLQKNGG